MACMVHVNGMTSLCTNCFLSFSKQRDRTSAQANKGVCLGRAKNWGEVVGVGIKGKGLGEKEFPYLKLLLNVLCNYTFTGSLLLQDSLLAFKGKSLTFLNMYCAHIYGIS